MTLMEIRDVRTDIAMPGDIITYNKLSYMFTDMNEGGRMIDLKHAHQLVAAYGLRGNVDEVSRPLSIVTHYRPRQFKKRMTWQVPIISLSLRINQITALATKQTTRTNHESRRVNILSHTLRFFELSVTKDTRIKIDGLHAGYIFMLLFV